jgi:hypothetical protein
MRVLARPLGSRSQAHRGRHLSRTDDRQDSRVWPSHRRALAGVLGTWKEGWETNEAIAAHAKATRAATPLRSCRS